MQFYSIKNGVITIAVGATTSLGHSYSIPANADKLKIDIHEKHFAKEPDEESKPSSIDKLENTFRDSLVSYNAGSFNNLPIYSTISSYNANNHNNWAEDYD